MAKRVVFVDTETTGLSREDRIVTLAMIGADAQSLGEDAHNLRALHLAFNPGRPSHPRARAVHGFSDEHLSWQDQFAEHIDLISAELDGDVTAVAHNASFDRRFLQREFDLAGRPLRVRFSCTMKEWRAQHDEGSASLKAILPQLGLRRAGELHGALEDAWLAMQVFRHLNGMPLLAAPDGLPVMPANWRSEARAIPAALAPPAIVVAAPPSQLAKAGPLADAMRPTATLLLHIARADGVFSQDELDVFTELAEATARRMNISADDDTVLDAVALTLGAPPLTLEAAARAVSSDQHARQEIAKWVRLVTYADGIGHIREQAAIEEIVDIFRLVHRP